jgi:hypothetical protein
MPASSMGMSRLFWTALADSLYTPMSMLCMSPEAITM